jgi:LmbE family N-acetylglucosaminyl deacetylase
MTDKKLSIVTVGAHAFDMMKGPGGTLIKYANAGHRVVPIILSDCIERGELPPETTPEEAAEIQQGEARKVAKFVGFEQPRFLHYSEMDMTNLSNDMGAISKIADVIREVKPDVVFVHWPEDQTQGFYNHGNAGILGAKAVKVAALSDYESDLPTHETKLVLYYLSTEFTPAHLSWDPTIFIDVTKEIRKVHQSFQIYRTHTASEKNGGVPSLLREYRLVMRRLYGVVSGTLYAEAFKLPQYLGAQLAYEWLPEPWVSTSGRSIMSNITDKATGAVAHPRLSIPTDWPDNVPVPAEYR